MRSTCPNDTCAPATRARNLEPVSTQAAPSTALLTDHYELTMIRAALADGTADRRCTFEVFARRLPLRRRYGVVAGIGRLVERLSEFRFGEAEIAALGDSIDAATLEWLRGYRFRGDIDAYAEGELYFPNSPILRVTGGFAECVILETLILSVLNHDCAVASAGARMVSVGDGRALIEMGSRRAHEEAAVAAARAAYLTGFTSTSNLEAERRWGVPSAGTSAHAFTLLHTRPSGADEKAAFRAQVDALGVGTTLLVDTYDITQGVANAIEVAGPRLGAVRIDSGDLGVLARQVRRQLDELGAGDTRIVVSGDLDEYAIAGLRAEPVDAYGIGTRLVTGSGAPTASMVYKLVEVDGIPVAKRSAHKETLPGAKDAYRTYRSTGTALEEVLTPVGADVSALAEEPRVNEVRPLLRPLFVGGEPVSALPSLEDSRRLQADARITLPWEGLSLAEGDPALAVRVIGR